MSRLNPFSAHHPWSEETDVDSDEDEAYRLPIPDRSAMEARWAFRETIRQETIDHRRIHEHGGMRDTGRNILMVLYDRERRGASALTIRRRVGSRANKGGVSPSTVFESPVSTVLIQPTESKEDENGPKKGRCISYPLTIGREVQTFAEYCSAVKYSSAFLYHLGGDDEFTADGQRPASSKAVSTISIAFSPDAATMASTHGDHTVKISCCHTGRLLQSLEGHPRTPWTVKYHPFEPEIVASGCLGHQVRLWNWTTKTCLQMVRLEFAIISLSFHPTGKVLAVANGTRLHFWGIDLNDTNGDATRSLTEMDQRHMLRCVRFPPSGTSIIIGGVNPTTEESRRRQRTGMGSGSMSFYLRLWDFNLERSLNTESDVTAAVNGISISRRAISNPRTFVPRALLYNDGGFDVSPDGKTLCACAEYWLPDGVDNAMDLVYKEERLYGADPVTETAKEPAAAADPSDDPAVAEADTKKVIVAALSQLRGLSNDSSIRVARSPSDREGPRTPTLPCTPPVPSMDYVPQTPPIPPQQRDPRQLLSPPSPPGRRFAGGLGQPQSFSGEASTVLAGNRGLSTPPPPPPSEVVVPQAPGGPNLRPPHPLSIVSRTGAYTEVRGRYVPHVITVSLDTDPIPEDVDHKLPRSKPFGAVANEHRPRLGQLIEACPLDPSKASAVTCVKFSPSTDFCLIGYGVREPVMEGGSNFHPVTAVYRIRGGMTHVSTMLSGDDDVNIARFHPHSGYGYVYGTKQGRVRILSPRPWNYYNC